MSRLRPCLQVSAEVALVLFAKNPEAGQAKTRLAPLLGEEGAAQVARSLLFDQLHKFKQTQSIMHVNAMSYCVASPQALPTLLQQALGGGVFHVQRGDDLGARMADVFMQMLRKHRAVVIVGADVPTLSSAILKEAALALSKYDAVIGPTHDGGYYLIGLTHYKNGIFDDVQWSTGSALQETVCHLKRMGYSIKMLETLHDLDTPEDYKHAHRQLKKRPLLSPCLARQMNVLGEAKVSVVVPVKNEALYIAEMLGELVADVNVTKVVVVDGQSSDGCKNIAEQVPGVQVISSAPRRARQMNAGAKLVNTEVIWFVHADASLPRGASQCLLKVLCDQKITHGAFQIKTQYDEQGKGRTWIKKWLWLADLRAKLTKLPYGDQGIFMRKKAFDAAGGYPDIALMEDLALARLLNDNGKYKLVKKEILVSARRFQQSPWRAVVAMNAFPLLYKLGISTKQLQKWYR